jgi:hypothetical protein
MQYAYSHMHIKMRKSLILSEGEVKQYQGVTMLIKKK